MLAAVREIRRGVIPALLSSMQASVRTLEPDRYGTTSIKALRPTRKILEAEVDHVA